MKKQNFPLGQVGQSTKKIPATVQGLQFLTELSLLLTQQISKHQSQ